MLKREHIYKKPINVILILAVLNQRYNKTLGGIDLLTYTESRAKQRNQRIHQLAGRKEKQTQSLNIRTKREKK